VQIPASKSHTVRAIAIGSLASGTSVVTSPLVSADTLSATEVYKGLGAAISIGDEWTIKGIGGVPGVPDNVLDVGNSGTTLYIAMGTAGLIDGYSVFTGDHQIRSRPAGPLLDALAGLGVEGFSTRGNGNPPLVIKGPMRGGQAELDGSKTSQYLTSLLLNCPLADGDTEILVKNATERPYIDMTLAWLDDQGVRYERDGYDKFYVPGRQQYYAFAKSIPGDFSSATFFLCAAAVTGRRVFHRRFAWPLTTVGYQLTRLLGGLSSPGTICPYSGKK
jgi:3-phosphoshikimate 1-carboxyvinyltransferase